MAYKPYQLTEWQYDKLLVASHAQAPIIVMPQSLTTDKPDAAALLDEYNKQMDDLLGLGMVKNTTDGFQSIIETYRGKRNANRPFRVFTLTEVGSMMFTYTDGDEGRKPN